MSDGTIEASGPSTEIRKRKNKFVKKRPNAKKIKYVSGMGKKNKVSDKKKKLFRKRAKEYNSDSEDDEQESEPESGDEEVEGDSDGDGDGDGDGSGDGDRGDSRRNGGKVESGGPDEGNHIQGGTMRFIEGCGAFRRAFESIMKGHANAADESLGPVLSAKKRLVVAKLAEEEVERKAKNEKRKKMLEINEMGHVKPTANFLDTHDKILIGIATKGVVKFLNAVNKAQKVNKDRKKFKDAKALTKRRKEVFMKELSRASTQSVDHTTKASMSSGQEDDQPAWAPLQDSFMLTNPKVKNWDNEGDEKDTETDI